MRRASTLVALALLAGGPATAALQGRDLDPARPGFEAYYDPLQDVTWMADGNHAKTSGAHPTGLMTFAEAASWAEQISYHGITGWRLPASLSARPAGCLEGYAGSECGFDSFPNASEIVSLFQRDWGLVSVYAGGQPDPSKTFGGPTSPFTGDGYRVQGLAPGVVFDGVQPHYWTAALQSTAIPCPQGADCEFDPVEGLPPVPPIAGYWRPPGSSIYFRCLIAAQCSVGDAPEPIVADELAVRVGSFEGRLIQPWMFLMIEGRLRYETASEQTAFVLAVHPGDVPAVPEPSTQLLLALGLAAVGRAARPTKQNADHRAGVRYSSVVLVVREFGGCGGRI